MNNKGNLVVIAILIIAVVGAFIYFSYLSNDSDDIQNELGFDIGIEQVADSLGNIPTLPSVPSSTSNTPAQNVSTPQPEVIPANVVRYTYDGFIPHRMVIEQGKQIIFRNETDLVLEVTTIHNPTHAQSYVGFSESEPIYNGKEWSVILLNPGTYGYRSKFRPEILGEIEVTPQQ